MTQRQLREGRIYSAHCLRGQVHHGAGTWTTGCRSSVTMLSPFKEKKVRKKRHICVKTLEAGCSLSCLSPDLISLCLFVFTPSIAFSGAFLGP